MLGFPVESVEETGDGRVLELEVTTNRPDCLNHLGVAREVSARLGMEVRVPDLSEPSGGGVAKPRARVSIEAPDLCPRYAARVMTDVRIGPSPDWLKRRIESVGQRPCQQRRRHHQLCPLRVGPTPARLRSGPIERAEDRRPQSGGRGTADHVGRSGQAPRPVHAGHCRCLSSRGAGRHHGRDGNGDFRRYQEFASGERLLRARCPSGVPPSGWECEPMPLTGLSGVPIRTWRGGP